MTQAELDYIVENVTLNVTQHLLSVAFACLMIYMLVKVCIALKAVAKEKQKQRKEKAEK